MNISNVPLSLLRKFIYVLFYILLKKLLTLLYSFINAQKEESKTLEQIKLVEFFKTFFRVYLKDQY